MNETTKHEFRDCNERDAWTICVDDVLEDIYEERERQHEKWGQQSHPDGTGGTILGSLAYYGTSSAMARQSCERAFADKRGTWGYILWEEVAEAFEETDPEKLEKELIQVAAVATAWVEDIRRRKAEVGRTAALEKLEALMPVLDKLPPLDLEALDRKLKELLGEVPGNFHILSCEPLKFSQPGHPTFKNEYGTNLLDALQRMAAPVDQQLVAPKNTFVDVYALEPLTVGQAVVCEGKGLLSRVPFVRPVRDGEFGKVPVFGITKSLDPLRVQTSGVVEFETSEHPF